MTSHCEAIVEIRKEFSVRRADIGGSDVFQDVRHAVLPPCLLLLVLDTLGQLRLQFSQLLLVLQLLRVVCLHLNDFLPRSQDLLHHRIRTATHRIESEGSDFWQVVVQAQRADHVGVMITFQ